MRFNFLIISVFVVQGLFAQNEILERYPFIHIEQSEIRVLGDDDKLEQFWEKLDRLAFTGEGNIDVLQMGGSHVQAGTLSQAMRDNLFAMSPGLKGNRGFFFPFSLAKTNEPSNFSVYSRANWEGFRCSVNNHEARWGMSGIVATTTDANAQVEVIAWDGPNEKQSFSSVRVYHPKESSNFWPTIDSSEYRVDTVFYNEERGFTEFRLIGDYESFKFHLEGSDSSEVFIWQGIEFMDHWPGMRYHAIGVNGASTKSYLRCVDFEKQMPALAPDLVVFGIGINDAYMSEDRFDREVFKARYDSIMDVLEEANPEVLFLFLTNNDSYYRRRYPNPNAVEVQKVMFELAEERDAILWDLFEVMGGLGSVDAWVEAGLARRDRIHFTREGYQLQAQLLSDAIQEAWLNHIRDSR